MATLNASLEYAPLTLPPGSAQVTQYRLTLENVDGQAVQSPVIATPGTTSWSFANVQPGTYKVHGENLDAAGQKVGTDLWSDPFLVETPAPEVTVTVLAKITVVLG